MDGPSLVAGICKPGFNCKHDDVKGRCSVQLAAGVGVRALGSGSLRERPSLESSPHISEAGKPSCSSSAHSCKRSAILGKTHRSVALSDVFVLLAPRRRRRSLSCSRLALCTRSALSRPLAVLESCPLLFRQGMLVFRKVCSKGQPTHTHTHTRMMLEAFPVPSKEKQRSRLHPQVMMV